VKSVQENTVVGSHWGVRLKGAGHHPEVVRSHNAVPSRNLRASYTVAVAVFGGNSDDIVLVCARHGDYCYRMCSDDSCITSFLQFLLYSSR